MIKTEGCFEFFSSNIWYCFELRVRQSDGLVSWRASDFECVPAKQRMTNDTAELVEFP